MMDNPAVAWTCTGLVVAAIFTLLFVSPALHKWERENGYPFGMLCELYRNCKELPETKTTFVERWAIEEK